MLFRLTLLVLSLFRVATIGRLLESTPPPSETRERPKAADLLEQYSGNAARMADKLADLHEDNYKLRGKNRDLAGEVAGLKKSQTPEGAVVLTGDDAHAYEAYKALGKPDEVKGKLDRVETISTELTGLKRAATIREVAELAGMKATVLTHLGGDLEYVVKDATDRDGNAARVVHVKVDGRETPLADYAAREWADFLPALAAGAGGTGQQTIGVRVPVQGSGDQHAPTNAVQALDQYRKQTYGARQQQ